MHRLLGAAAFLAALAGSLAPRTAAAQAQVYEAQAPAGSAYLRFVNALGGAVALKPDFLPAVQFGTEPAGRVGPYTVVERVAGRDLTLEVREGARTGKVVLRAEPGRFLTVILHDAPGGGIAATPVTDEAEFNRARARLSFYNAAPGCPAASLSLDPGGPTVFDGVAPGTAKMRSVNPVEAGLRAACGDKAAPSFPLTGLEAGGTYSIWLMQVGGQWLGFAGRDRTTPWRP